MKRLNYELKKLCQANREGSFVTQVNRAKYLQSMAKQLEDLGYRHMGVRSLKTRHVNALIKHWQAQELSFGTLKNRIAYLRWWANKINKQNIVARSNKEYSI